MNLTLKTRIGETVLLQEWLQSNLKCGRPASLSGGVRSRARNPCQGGKSNCTVQLSFYRGFIPTANWET